MSINVSPGVYPTELDLSEYVRSVATFKVGMVAITDRGLEGREGARQEIRTWDDFLQRAGGFRSDSYGAYAAKTFFENDGGSLYVSRVFALDGDGVPATAVRAEAKAMNTATTPAEAMLIEAYSFGAWGDDLDVQITANQTVYADGFDLRVIFKGIQVERFTHLTFDELSLDYVEAKVRSRYIRVKELAAGVMTDQSLSLTGGADGVTGVADSDYIAAIQNFVDSPITVMMVPGNTSASVVEEALSFAETKGDLICILDTPQGLNVEGAILFRENGAVPFDSSFGAMYFPWLITRNPINNLKKTVPPSGAIAGVYSRGHVWDAPAGLNRGVLKRIVGTEQLLDEQYDRDKLYERQLNPIASFLDTGAVVWGQKTLQQKPTSLDRVNVRNMINFIKRAVTSQSRALLFEPNTPKLWNRFKRNTSPFLQKLKDSEALYSFEVVVDETINTPDVVEQNRMIAKIYLQPSKTAEIIELQFVLTPSGVDFSEFVTPAI